MDFLDPRNARRNQTRLLLGYCLVALAIGIATLILLYWSYGYTIDRKGQVTQSGLVFLASQPSGGAIYLNGQQYSSDTNARMSIPAGAYDIKITKPGYRDWKRQVVVNGGDVQHFDYPFLFPSQLNTTAVADLGAGATVATQSPDKRWLLFGQSDNSGSFVELDLKDTAKPVQTELSLPVGTFTPGDGVQSWSVVDWASDNRHVLLLHTYQTSGATQSEYILLDRDTPADSTSITNTFQLSQSESADLFNDRTSQYYVYNKDTQVLRLLNASDGSEASHYEHVLAYKSHGDNMLVYATDQPPTGKQTAGQASIVLQAGQKTVTLRTVPSGGEYVLNIAQYSGSWYVAAGSSTDTAAYIYKNPQNQPTTSTQVYPDAWRRLPVLNPSFLSFSSNSQFLLAESGQNFVVYDLENVEQYHYRATEPIDLPQTHAVWMDGDRLEYVSGGKLEVFDYDYRNRQSLEDADANYPAFFAHNYSYVYSLKAPSGDTKASLTSTPLTVK